MVIFSMTLQTPKTTLFPYTTLFRSREGGDQVAMRHPIVEEGVGLGRRLVHVGIEGVTGEVRSEEHTSELQSRRDLVCRLLLEKKKELIAMARRIGESRRYPSCRLGG